MPEVAPEPILGNLITCLTTNALPAAAPCASVPARVKQLKQSNAYKMKALCLAAVITILTLGRAHAAEQPTHGELRHACQMALKHINNGTHSEKPPTAEMLNISQCVFYFMGIRDGVKYPRDLGVEICLPDGSLHEIISEYIDRTSMLPKEANDKEGWMGVLLFLEAAYSCPQDDPQ